MRLLLTHRRNLKRKFLDLENAIRHSLKSFGMRLGKVGRGGFEGRSGRRAPAMRSPPNDGVHADGARRAVAAVSHAEQACGPAGRARRAMPALHGDPRRRSGDRADVQHGDRRSSRFRRSRDVAAYFGLTSKRWQSGTSIDVQGRISKAGDPDVRRALYEAASAMLTRYKGKTAIKSWGRSSRSAATRKRSWRWPASSP